MKTTKRPVLYKLPKIRVRCISGHKWVKRDSSAAVSSVSPKESKGQRLKRQYPNLFTLVNLPLVMISIFLINQIFLFYSPPTQHHSFLRNLPPYPFVNYCLFVVCFLFRAALSCQTKSRGQSHFSILYLFI